MAYNRRYILKVTPLKRVGNSLVESGMPVVITDPLTINFNVKKEMYAGANCSAHIELYNLDKSTRDKLFYDWLYFEDLRKIELQAGYYDGKFDLIYKGLIRTCHPKKLKTDVVMVIDANSGLYCLDEVLSISVESSESRRDIISRIINDSTGIDEGTISTDEVVCPRTISLLGSPAGLLETYSSGKMYVNNDEVYVLNAEDVVEGYVRVIDDESGLLGVPERDRTTIKINCMFEPRIVIGQVVEIKSSIAPVFDGQYKVWGISHNGIISGTESGSLITTLTLYTGEQVFGYFKSSWKEVD